MKYFTKEELEDITNELLKEPGEQRRNRQQANKHSKNVFFHRNLLVHCSFGPGKQGRHTLAQGLCLFAIGLAEAFDPLL